MGSMEPGSPKITKEGSETATQGSGPTEDQASKGDSESEGARTEPMESESPE